MGRPPPHPHQVPPPLHPPHNFMAPPPDFVSLQGTSLGAVGSQRSGETQSTTNNPLSRNTNGTMGQIPHLQQVNIPYIGLAETVLEANLGIKIVPCNLYEFMIHINISFIES